MMKPASMILSLLVANMALAQPPESSGQASCSQIDKEGRYHVAWNLSSSPRTYYWVQRFVPDAQTWRSLWKPVTASYASSETAVDGGSLYRVYACNDSAGTQDCTSTTVCWVPVRPRSIDDIPATMPDGHGQTMTVAKNTDLETQTQQYNVYRVVQIAGNIDLSLMPPMTPPRERDPDPSTDSGLTPDELIHLGVYENYEALRTLALEQKK
jgi:hypothetical protein